MAPTANTCILYGLANPKVPKQKVQNLTKPKRQKMIKFNVCDCSPVVHSHNVDLIFKKYFQTIFNKPFEVTKVKAQQKLFLWPMLAIQIPEDLPMQIKVDHRSITILNIIIPMSNIQLFLKIHQMVDL